MIRFLAEKLHNIYLAEALNQSRFRKEVIAMVKTDKVGLTLPGFSMTVERGKIREMALAIGDNNPIYFDSDAARQAGFRDITAPPTFLEVIDMWAGADFMTLCRELELNPVNVLHGEQEYEYLADICAGDEISGRCQVVDFSTKSGSSGGMNIISLETTYTNQDGQLVAIARSKTIERF